MVTLRGLDGFLRKHKRVGLDTSILIYLTEAHPVFGPLAKKLFESIEDGRNRGICSTISLLEVLVQPYRLKNDDLVNQFYVLLTTVPNLTWKDLSVPIADMGANFRAKYRLKTPDAIVMATAIESGATGFVGNDAELKRVKELDVLVLSA